MIDHKIIAKILSEISHTLKRANKLPRMGEGDENNVTLINLQCNIWKFKLLCLYFTVLFHNKNEKSIGSNGTRN